jgi:hypothetical protein
MLKYLVAAMASVSALSLAPAGANVILYEGFDMGATAGTLTGKSGATSVGFASGSTWTDHSDADAVTKVNAMDNYQTTGLTFSYMPVVGGSASLAIVNAGGGGTRSDAARQLGFSATGSIYGSYLVKLAPTTHNTQDITAMIIGTKSNYGGVNQADAFENSFQMEVNADGFGTEPTPPGTGGFGAGRIHGDLAAANNFSTGGTVLSEGTTYLAIFKMTGLGASAQTQTLTEWILTADQYDNFETGGLTESELNAATLGTASTNVQQRGTTSTTDNAQVLSAYYMHLFGALGANATVDELRISDSSIDQAVAVPRARERSDVIRRRLVNGIGTSAPRSMKRTSESCDSGID